MSKGFVFILMIFCHIVDDYYLQGILSQMKQIEWWKKNAPERMYENDWVIALTMHSFSWAFMIMLPIAIWQQFDLSTGYYIAFIANMLVHLVTDNLKANMKSINLMTDQSVHFAQILFTFIILVA